MDLKGCCKYMSNMVPPIRGGSPAWGLSDRLTNRHSKRQHVYEILGRASDFCGSLERSKYWIIGQKIFSMEYQESTSGRVTVRFKERYAGDMLHVWGRRKYIGLPNFGRVI